MGVGWAEAESIEEGLILLPAPSRIYYQEALSAGWADGISYWIELEENEPNIERHILLTAGDGVVYDFYASAPSQPELAHLEPVLVRMFASISRAATIGGPVDISVQFLSALLRDPAGEVAAIFLDQALQSQVQAGGSYLPLLGLEGEFNSFTVARLPQTDSSVHVQALLGLPAGVVEERTIVLSQQENAWRITAFLHPDQP